MVSLWRRVRRKRPPLPELNTADIIAFKSSIERSIDSLEAIAHVFTAFVAVGLIIEYRDPFVNFIRTHEWRYITGSIGGVLVTVGVAGELLAGFRSTTKDGMLREANSTLAYRSAELLMASNERIAELNLMAEKERLARAQIEQSISMRSFTPDQLSAFASDLSAFANDALCVYVGIGAEGHEPVTFARNIGKALSNAKINTDNGGSPLKVPFIQGVYIIATPDDESQALAGAISDALSRAGHRNDFFSTSVNTPYDYHDFWPLWICQKKEPMVAIVVMEQPRFDPPAISN